MFKGRNRLWQLFWVVQGNTSPFQYCPANINVWFCGRIDIYCVFFIFIPQMILSNWHVSVIVLITKLKVICLFFFFVATPLDVWDLSSLTKYWTHAPCRGSNWKLTTGSPGKSGDMSFYSQCSSQSLIMQDA